MTKLTLIIFCLGILSIFSDVANAEQSASANFTLRGDGFASANSMSSANHQLFSVLGDSRAVGVSASSSFKVSSSLVFLFRSGGAQANDLLCVPIRASNGAIALVCL